jgi:transposase
MGDTPFSLPREQQTNMEDPSTRYPSDVSELQWKTVSLLIPSGRPIGADRVTSMRAVVNAVLYRERSGCPWRMLPHDFPHWRTVYGYFRTWQAEGVWEQLQAAIRQEIHAAPPSPAHSNPSSRAPADAIDRNNTGTKNAC